MNRPRRGRGDGSGGGGTAVGGGAGQPGACAVRVGEGTGLGCQNTGEILPIIQGETDSPIIQEETDSPIIQSSTLRYSVIGDSGAIIQGSAVAFLLGAGAVCGAAGGRDEGHARQWGLPAWWAPGTLASPGPRGLLASTRP